MKNQEQNEKEPVNDTYYRYWSRFLGFDFINTQTQRRYTKGEFYRLHTKIAESLAVKENQLPEPFILIKRENQC